MEYQLQTGNFLSPYNLIFQLEEDICKFLNSVIQMEGKNLTKEQIVKSYVIIKLLNKEENLTKMFWNTVFITNKKSYRKMKHVVKPI